DPMAGLLEQGPQLLEHDRGHSLLLLGQAGDIDLEGHGLARRFLRDRSCRIRRGQRPDESGQGTHEEGGERLVHLDSSVMNMRQLSTAPRISALFARAPASTHLDHWPSSMYAVTRMAARSS